MGSVLIDQDHAVAGLGDDVGLMDLSAGGTKGPINQIFGLRLLRPRAIGGAIESPLNPRRWLHKAG